MTQSNYNTLNIILFAILAFAFFLGSLQYGRLTLDFDHIEKALKTERIAREKLINQKGELICQADIVHLYERKPK